MISTYLGKFQDKYSVLINYCLTASSSVSFQSLHGYMLIVYAIIR